MKRRPKTGDLVKMIPKGAWMTGIHPNPEAPRVGTYVENRTGDPTLPGHNVSYHEILVNGHSGVYDFDYFWDFEVIS